MADTCSTCRHWVATDWTTDDKAPRAPTHGNCHCHPPQVVTPAPGRRITVFPITDAGEGCGEHKPVGATTYIPPFPATP